MLPLTSCSSLIFLDHIWYRLGCVRNSRLCGGFTRTYGHLGSPILGALLDQTGNHETPLLAMMATPELNRWISWSMLIPCWYHMLFWSMFVQFFKIVENVWSALWAEYIPTVFCGSQCPHAGMSVPSPSMCVPRGGPGLSTVHLLLKNPRKKSGVVISANFYHDSHWTEKSENGRCGLLVALCWTYHNLWSPIRGRYGAAQSDFGLVQLQVG